MSKKERLTFSTVQPNCEQDSGGEIHRTGDVFFMMLGSQVGEQTVITYMEVQIMNKERKFWQPMMLAFGVFFFILVLASCAITPKMSTPEGYQQADIKHGALLYDKWYKIKDVEVTGNHPLYPAEAKKAGVDTWRCKECHGWDYIGKNGRYQKGSHYTGINGVYEARTKSPEELFSALTDQNKKHDFSADLTDSDVWALVKFLREGLIDPKTVFSADGSLAGDAARGKTLFGTQCATAQCHGNDGNKLDFKGSTDGIQGVGWIAKDNPQETLHKIRWGHPGSDMPSTVIDGKLSDADSVDILTYSQRLK